MRRGRTCFVTAAILMLATLIASAGAPARAAGSCSGGDPVIDDQERAFLVTINDYRARNGLKPLGLSPSLNRAAAWFAQDMADKGYFGHNDPTGRDPSKRANDCGYPGQAGENNAAGSYWSDAQQVFDAWKASPGHNANMLNPIYVVIGIARSYNPASPYGWYWVTDFGLDPDPQAPPDPTPKPSPTPVPAPPPATAANVVLYAGANLVTWVGNTVPAAAGIEPAAAAVTAIYTYDAGTGAWARFGPSLPAYVNSIQSLERGRAYWMIATDQAVLRP